MKKTFYLLAAAFTAFCCASCTDDAKPVITVESVTIQTSQLTLMPGETAQLEATVTPSDAANSDVTWTTSNDRRRARYSSKLRRGHHNRNSGQQERNLRGNRKPSCAKHWRLLLFRRFMVI